jgi:hypothetical protein
MISRGRRHHEHSIGIGTERIPREIGPELLRHRRRRDTYIGQLAEMQHDAAVSQRRRERVHLERDARATRVYLRHELHKEPV